MCSNPIFYHTQNNVAKNFVYKKFLLKKGQNSLTFYGGGGDELRKVKDNFIKINGNKKIIAQNLLKTKYNITDESSWF